MSFDDLPDLPPAWWGVILLDEDDSALGQLVSFGAAPFAALLQEAHVVSREALPERLVDLLELLKVF